MARASDDSRGADDFARAAAALPHVTLISLTVAMSRQAIELAAAHRLRGADAVYLAVARRYGTTVVTRDGEQRLRGSAVLACLTPAEAITARSPARRPRRPRKSR